MANKKNAAIRHLAEHLFVEKGWKQNAIADYLGIAEKTIIEWKKKDAWETKRIAISAAPHTIKSTLLAEMNKIINGEQSKINADALSKMYKVVADLDQDLSAEVCMSVFEEFDLFMVNKDPKMALQFTEYHRQFLIHKLTKE